MARISLDPPRTVLYRLVEEGTKRAFGGTVPDPGRAQGHNMRVLLTNGVQELGVARWNRLAPTLKALAQMAAGARIGCSWCMDYGFWESAEQGVDRAKLTDVPVWRDSDTYTAVERSVMAYAEAMTADPMEVTDAMVTELEADLGTPALVELTAIVAVENQRSRFNSALGLTSQGFKDRCSIADAPATGAVRHGDR